MPTTENMSARIESLTFGGRPSRQPSQRALATRSLTATERLTGEARREALREHFERFLPSVHSCPSHR